MISDLTAPYSHLIEDTPEDSRLLVEEMIKRKQGTMAPEVMRMLTGNSYLAHAQAAQHLPDWPGFKVISVEASDGLMVLDPQDWPASVFIIWVVLSNKLPGDLPVEARLPFSEIQNGVWEVRPQQDPYDALVYRWHRQKQRAVLLNAYEANHYSQLKKSGDKLPVVDWKSH